MNNAFNYQNDLTGFRSQLSEITSKHDNAVANARAVAVGGKARLIQKAKDLKEAGDSLVKQGLEAEIVPTAGAAIFKGGKAIYSRLSAPSQGGATNEGVDAPQTSTSGENISSRVADATEETPRVAEEMPRVARPINPNTNEEFRAGQGRGRELDDVEDERPFIDETPDPYGRAQPGQDEGEDLAGEDAGEDVVNAGGEAITNASEAGSNALSSALGGATDAADAAAEGASGLAESAISGASDLAGSAAAGIGEGLSGAASGLAEAAGATSWIPFVGEVVGGVAALAALGAAGYGAYEEIKGAIDEGSAEAQKVVPKPVAPADVAGSFIAPQQSSQEE